MLYLGRASSLQASQARVPQLLLDTYEELEDWAPYIDPFLRSEDTSLPTYTQRSAYAVLTFNAMARLFEISSKIVRAFYSIKSLKSFSQHIRDVKTAVELKLKRWFSSLSTHLQFDPETDVTPPPHQLMPQYVRALLSLPLN